MQYWDVPYAKRPALAEVGPVLVFLVRLWSCLSYAVQYLLRPTEHCSGRTGCGFAGLWLHRPLSIIHVVDVDLL